MFPECLSLIKGEKGVREKEVTSRVLHLNSVVNQNKVREKKGSRERKSQEMGGEW